MTRAELEFYSHNVPAIRKALERIANALENQNQFVVNTIKGQNHKAAFEAEQAQDEAVDKAVDRILDNGIDFQVNKEDEELDTQHDYLHQLVQNLDREGYYEFCNAHCLPANDAVAVSNYITDLDYDEVLGIINDLEVANEDAIPDTGGAPYDDDYDLRCTAKMYKCEIHPASDIKTKKDAILDYVTNEFGSHGARYTDIIKFAYYLNHTNGPRYSYDNRGYYSCAMTHNRWGFGHLVYGGKDHFVKGINQDGKERYFALSHVESVTDYWKYCDNRKK